MADLWTFFSESRLLSAVFGLLVGCFLLRDIGRVALSILEGAWRARRKGGKPHA